MTVISLAERRNKAKDSEPVKAEPATEIDLKAIEERNKKNKERVERERKAANNSVARSHNLKPNDPNNKR